MLKKSGTVLLLIILFSGTLAAQDDFSFRFNPGLAIPIPSAANTALYSLGFSGQLKGQYQLTDILYLDGLINYTLTPLQAGAGTLNIIAPGVGIGVGFDLFPFLSMQAGVDLGWYFGFMGGRFTF